MRAFRRYLILFGVVTLGWSMFLLRHMGATYPAVAGPQFDRSIRRNYLTYITENQPDIVLLGDSMLDVGVDPIELTEQLDRKVYRIGILGSASTLWYLVLKNNILEAPVLPRYVIVFFRDSLLTVPGFRVQGRYFEQIDEYATPKDLILIDRAFLNLMSPLEIWAERLFPPFTFRWPTREKLDASTRYFLPEKILGCANDCTDLAMGLVFGDNKMVDPKLLSQAIAAGDQYLFTRERLNFKQQVNASFLPEFIHLTREHDVQLIFVQMKTLRPSAAAQELRDLNSYRSDLTSYLDQNGVVYLDFSDDPRIRNEYFYDPLHFTPEGRTVFTGLLIDALRPHIH